MKILLNLSVGLWLWATWIILDYRNWKTTQWICRPLNKLGFVCTPEKLVTQDVRKDEVKKLLSKVDSPLGRGLVRSIDWYNPSSRGSERKTKDTTRSHSSLETAIIWNHANHFLLGSWQLDIFCKINQAEIGLAVSVSVGRAIVSCLPAFKLYVPMLSYAEGRLASPFLFLLLYFLVSRNTLDINPPSNTNKYVNKYVIASWCPHGPAPNVWSVWIFLWTH